MTKRKQVTDVVPRGYLPRVPDRDDDIACDRSGTELAELRSMNRYADSVQYYVRILADPINTAALRTVATMVAIGVGASTHRHLYDTCAVPGPAIATLIQLIYAIVSGESEFDLVTDESLANGIITNHLSESSETPLDRWNSPVDPPLGGGLVYPPEFVARCLVECLSHTDIFPVTDTTTTTTTAPILALVPTVGNVDLLWVPFIMQDANANATLKRLRLGSPVTTTMTTIPPRIDPVALVTGGSSVEMNTFLLHVFDIDTATTPWQQLGATWNAGVYLEAGTAMNRRYTELFHLYHDLLLAAKGAAVVVPIARTITSTWSRAHASTPHIAGVLALFAACKSVGVSCVPPPSPSPPVVTEHRPPTPPPVVTEQHHQQPPPPTVTTHRPPPTAVGVVPTTGRSGPGPIEVEEDGGMGVVAVTVTETASDIVTATNQIVDCMQRVRGEVQELSKSCGQLYTDMMHRMMTDMQADTAEFMDPTMHMRMRSMNMVAVAELSMRQFYGEIPSILDAHLGACKGAMDSVAGLTQQLQLQGSGVINAIATTTTPTPTPLSVSVNEARGQVHDQAADVRERLHAFGPYSYTEWKASNRIVPVATEASQTSLESILKLGVGDSVHQPLLQRLLDTHHPRMSVFAFDTDRDPALHFQVCMSPFVSTILKTHDNLRQLCGNTPLVTVMDVGRAVGLSRPDLYLLHRRVDALVYRHVRRDLTLNVLLSKHSLEIRLYPVHLKPLLHLWVQHQLDACTACSLRGNQSDDDNDDDGAPPPPPPSSDTLLSTNHAAASFLRCPRVRAAVADMPVFDAARCTVYSWHTMLAALQWQLYALNAPPTEDDDGGGMEEDDDGPTAAAGRSQFDMMGLRNTLPELESGFEASLKILDRRCTTMLEQLHSRMVVRTYPLALRGIIVTTWHCFLRKCGPILHNYYVRNAVALTGKGIDAAGAETDGTTTPSNDADAPEAALRRSIRQSQTAAYRDGAVRMRAMDDHVAANRILAAEDEDGEEDIGVYRMAQQPSSSSSSAQRQKGVHHTCMTDSALFQAQDTARAERAYGIERATPYSVPQQAGLRFYYLNFDSTHAPLETVARRRWKEFLDIEDHIDACPPNRRLTPILAPTAMPPPRRRVVLRPTPSPVKVRCVVRRDRRDAPRGAGDTKDDNAEDDDETADMTEGEDDLPVTHLATEYDTVFGVPLEGERVTVWKRLDELARVVGAGTQPRYRTRGDDPRRSRYEPARDWNTPDAADTGDGDDDAGDVVDMGPPPGPTTGAGDDDGGDDQTPVDTLGGAETLPMAKRRRTA
jgi:hypothetical protein